MENSFDLLEEKVRKAADLVRRLRKENAALEEQLTSSKGRLADAEKKLQGLEKERLSGAEHARELESLRGEVKALRGQRDEVRGRIEKLVELLEALD